MSKTNRIFFGLSLLIIALGAAVLVFPMTETCAAGGGCMERASGRGELVTPGNKRIISFTATANPDGTAVGKVVLINKAADFVAEIDVKCLDVVGNRARIAGFVTSTTDPNFNNNVAVFEVFDNGNPQGTNDTNSLVFFTPPGGIQPTPAYCRAFENFPQQSFGDGNLQVQDCP